MSFGSAIHSLLAFVMLLIAAFPKLTFANASSVCSADQLITDESFPRYSVLSNQPNTEPTFLSKSGFERLCRQSVEFRVQLMIRSGRTIYFDQELIVYPIDRSRAPTQLFQRAILNRSKNFENSNDANCAVRIKQIATVFSNGELPYGTGITTRFEIPHCKNSLATIAAIERLTPNSVITKDSKPMASLPKITSAINTENSQNHRERVDPIEIETASLVQLSEELLKAKVELNRKLVFPISDEPYISFLIDGSSSLNGIFNGKKHGQLTYLDLAIEHLRVTVSLLKPNQQFSIAISGKTPTLFKEGAALLATPENVKEAILFLDEVRGQRNTVSDDDDNSATYGNENFDEVIEKVILNSRVPDRVMIFTDGGVTTPIYNDPLKSKLNYSEFEKSVIHKNRYQPRNVSERFLNSVRGQAVVDIAPINNKTHKALTSTHYNPREVFEKLERIYYTHENARFIPEVTQKTGGTLLPAVVDFPDGAAVAHYRKLLMEVRKLKQMTE